MNPNPNETTTPVVRKTQIVTLWSRQRRMQDFYNYLGSIYIALGKTTPWVDIDNEEISDTYPPIPSETMTEVQEMIGMQRILWKKYAKPYVSPTTAQKDDVNTVPYKGLFYETTNDVDKAIAEGFTSVMFLMTSDRDAYFPVGVAYRQIGVYIGVNATDLYMSREKYMGLPLADKGNLDSVENFMPIYRQLDQLESHYCCYDF